ncbi:hypothetical protein NM688_g85 [Phlebia brevispora]|uniref:Uncharacterized protein n=1 Tax=Phlebia brevispora TaxID=194682 RepID=A0ACC1TF77_9APHY|nr:hypothetical protein NM688_g85 [Phlebia brevispora]
MSETTYLHSVPRSSSSSPDLEDRLFRENAADVSRRAIQEFFERTKMSMHSWRSDPTGIVEKRTRAEIKTWTTWDFTAPQYERAILTSICVATTMFGHTHIETQVHLSLFSLLAGCVDDLEIDPVALESFVERLYAGLPQLHPVLELLVGKLKRMPDYYPPFSATAIFAGTVQFINATLFDKRSRNLRPASLPWIRYKRARNSLGEVYGLFAWDKFNFPDVSTHIQILPDARIYLDYANDILSFYKEELEGETSNVIHDRAAVTGKDLSEVLSDLLDESVNAVARARDILQGEKEKQTWEIFIAGYVAFHFLSPRYRLKELTGHAYI